MTSSEEVSGASCRRCGTDIFQEGDGRWAAAGVPVDNPYECEGGAHAPAGSLFETGPFKLPTGNITHFKIECDMLQKEDWAALARLAAAMVPPFGSVEGVPRGAVTFGRELEAYITPSSSRLLIAEDVWVTGLSMESHRAGRDAIGVVAFARRPVADWVTPILNLNPLAEEATYRLDQS